ncbi:unnamed protein product [Ilex paraguariensis]|uniref:Uncharacterized protein n=1 Tax=Ilex paraguariensis TaxID=185542 RepID=A0ABC8RXF8_9AQUA
MVHPAALGDADFMELLCLSAEEYGFCNDGILRIRYEAEAFVDWYIKGAKQKMFKMNECCNIAPHLSLYVCSGKDLAISN